MDSAPEPTSYTSLDLAQVQAILSKYYTALGTADELTELKGGYANSNYRLSYTPPGDGAEQQTVCFKVCDEKNSEEILVQMAVLDALKAAGYKTCYTVANDEGGALTLTDDGLRVVIYDFLDGKPPVGSPGVLTQLGAATAALHNVPPPDGIVLPSFPMAPVVDEEITGSAVADHPFLVKMKAGLDSIADALSADLPQGLVHSDIFLDNTIFSSDGTLLGIVDFEEVCLAPFVLDVAMAVLGCCYSPDSPELDIDLARCILEGYKTTRDLNADEVSYFVDYVAYSVYACAFWRFRQFKIRRPDPGNSDSYLQITARLDALDRPALQALVEEVFGSA